MPSLLLSSGEKFTFIACAWSAAVAPASGKQASALNILTRACMYNGKQIYTYIHTTSHINTDYTTNSACKSILIEKKKYSNFFFSLLRICGTCCLSKCLHLVFFPFMSACRFPFTALRGYISQLPLLLLLLAKQCTSMRPTTIVCRSRSMRMPLCVANVTLACFARFCRMPRFSLLAARLSVCLTPLCLPRFCLLAAIAFLTLFCNFFQCLTFLHHDYATIFIFILFLPFAFLVGPALSVAPEKEV